MNRYFFDTEFFEDGRTIDPISYAIVAEDGDELYMELAFDEGPILACPDPFVRDQVLPHLRWPKAARYTRAQARDTLLMWLDAKESAGGGRRDRPELWAYFASYDWVVHAQLFGRMVDLPRWTPMHPMCLQQWWVQLGRPDHVKPPKPKDAHDALADARWNREFHSRLTTYARRPQLPRLPDGWSWATEYSGDVAGMPYALGVATVVPAHEIERLMMMEQALINRELYPDTAKIVDHACALWIGAGRPREGLGRPDDAPDGFAQMIVAGQR